MFIPKVRIKASIRGSSDFYNQLSIGPILTQQQLNEGYCFYTNPQEARKILIAIGAKELPNKNETSLSFSSCYNPDSPEIAYK